MGNITVTNKINEVVSTIDNKLDRAVLTMATDIHREATILAPFDTGALAGSGRISRNGKADYDISFGGSRVPYAKLRHFKNKKNPQTLRYLERAGNKTARNLNRYLGTK
jgi:hypothetical protein